MSQQTRMDLHSVKALSFQTKAKGSSSIDAFAAYCTGQIGVETTTRSIKKTCRGVTTHEITKPVSMALTFNVFAPIEFARRWFGLSGDGLVEGVYKYSTAAIPGNFVIVAQCEDEFEKKTEFKVFPNVSPTGGYKMTIDNDADEVAKIEFTGTAQPDEKGAFFYEADNVLPEKAETWLTKWERTLVEAPGA